MLFKSLLAATIVTVSAVAWQVKFVPTDEPARTHEVAEPAPPWVANPESHFAASQPGLLLATGSAKITGNVSMAHNRALLQARMKLVKARGALLRAERSETTRTLPNGTVETTVRSENPTTVTTTKTTDTKTVTFERVDGQLTGNRELAQWTSPEGVLWVLVATGR